MSLKKADPALKDALENSNPDETLRVVLQLNLIVNPTAEPVLEAATDRRALVARRVRLIAELMRPVKEALSKAGLTIEMTGGLTSMVVVAGTPAALMKALKLRVVVD